MNIYTLEKTQKNLLKLEKSCFMNSESKGLWCDILCDINTVIKNLEKAEK